jgi:hypothetical protein
MIQIRRPSKKGQNCYAIFSTHQRRPFFYRTNPQQENIVVKASQKSPSNTKAKLNAKGKHGVIQTA